jgi:hypothetical protein
MPAERSKPSTTIRRSGIWCQPGTELNFKFYRQATNKIVGISDEAAAFLAGFFQL